MVEICKNCGGSGQVYDNSSGYGEYQEELTGRWQDGSGRHVSPSICPECGGSGVDHEETSVKERKQREEIAEKRKREEQLTRNDNPKRQTTTANMNNKNSKKRTGITKIHNPQWRRINTIFFCIGYLISIVAITRLYGHPDWPMWVLALIPALLIGKFWGAALIIGGLFLALMMFNQTPEDIDGVASAARNTTTPNAWLQSNKEAIFLTGFGAALYGGILFVLSIIAGALDDTTKQWLVAKISPTMKVTAIIVFGVVSSVIVLMALAAGALTLYANGIAFFGGESEISTLYEENLGHLKKWLDGAINKKQPAWPMVFFIPFMFMNFVLIFTALCWVAIKADSKVSRKTLNLCLGLVTLVGVVVALLVGVPTP